MSSDLEALSQRPPMIRLLDVAFDEFVEELTRRVAATPYSDVRPSHGCVFGTIEPDGSRLTELGVPTPNLFTGGHNFHGKLEFNSRKGLEKSTDTLVNLVQIWAEKSK